MSGELELVLGSVQFQSEVQCSLVLSSEPRVTHSIVLSSSLSCFLGTRWDDVQVNRRAVGVGDTTDHKAGELRTDEASGFSGLQRPNEVVLNDLQESSVSQSGSRKLLSCSIHFQ